MKRERRGVFVLVGIVVLSVAILAYLGTRPGKPIPGGTAKASTAAVPTRASASNPALGSAVRTYLSDNFTGTTWYGDITSVDVSGSRVTIKTDIYGDAEGKQYAQPICGVARTMSSFVSCVNHYTVLDRNGYFLCSG